MSSNPNINLTAFIVFYLYLLFPEQDFYTFECLLSRSGLPEKLIQVFAKLLKAYHFFPALHIYQLIFYMGCNMIERPKDLSPILLVLAFSTSSENLLNLSFAPARR